MFEFEHKASLRYDRKEKRSYSGNFTYELNGVIRIITDSEV
jgi:hypothetical protein